MKNEMALAKLFAQIQILRPPKLHLATFGTTTLNYVVLSPIVGDEQRCRLREGVVTAQKPAILTPELWRRRFEGFGEEEPAFGEAMEQLYGGQLRALEYTFKNELKETRLENSSATETAQRIGDLMKTENAPRSGLLQAPDPAWSLAVMKFVVDLSLRSFSSNVRELDERGFFDPEGREQARRTREIERLFSAAANDPAARQPLAETLKAWNLFSQYEDRFFSLFSR